jgi:hypothetical protein
MNVELLFVGRAKEIRQLTRLHQRHKHALIIGSAGVGKTALVSHIQEKHDLLLCPDSEHQGALCETLEAGLGLAASGLKLPRRKQRLLRALEGTPQTVVFDHVGWTTPKLSSFLEGVMVRVPVWICTRSEHPWDIGHFWRLLVRFDKIELHPFCLAETRAWLAAAVEAGLIPGEAEAISEWLHHRSKGSPLVLCELAAEMAAHTYDLGNRHALQRLDLDRRIHELFPGADVGQGVPKGE